MSGATTLGWTSGSAFTVTNAGQTAVTVRAINGAGTASTTTSKTVSIDRTAPPAPTVNLNGYTSGNWINTGVTIGLSSTDTGGSGLWKFEYSHDQITWWDWPGAGGTGSWLINWEVTVPLYARAVDWSGNRSVSSSIGTINIDKTAPVLSALSNTSSGNWTNSTVTLSWTASDSGGSGLSAGATASPYSANYGMQFIYGTTTTPPSWGDPYTNPSNINQPTAGASSYNGSSAWGAQRTNYVYFRIWDRAGNVSNTYPSTGSSGTSSSNRVRIDTTNPTYGTYTCDRYLRGAGGYYYDVTFGADTGGSGFKNICARISTFSTSETCSPNGDNLARFISTTASTSISLNIRRVYDYAGNSISSTTTYGTISCTVHAIYGD
jgi:hypothetical protein